MKKEELVSKLENAELPDLLILSHKERLKAVLLEGMNARKTAKESHIVGSIRPGIRSWFEWLRVPVWRAAVASTLVICVTGSILALAFYFASPSPAVIAADVVKKDPGIQQRLSGAGEIIIVRVDVKDRIASVVCGRGMGDFIEADVDINGRSVVNTKRFEGLFVAELPQAAQDSAAKIAFADPKVKSMMDKGASVGKIFPIFSAISSITIVNGNLVKVTPSSPQAVVPVYFSGKVWLIQVNLEGQRVERIVEPESRVVPYFELYYMLKLL